MQRHAPGAPPHLAKGGQPAQGARAERQVRVRAGHRAGPSHPTLASLPRLAAAPPAAPTAHPPTRPPTPSAPPAHPPARALHRDSARAVLVSMSRELGAHHIPFICDVLQSACTTPGYTGAPCLLPLLLRLPPALHTPRSSTRAPTPPHTAPPTHPPRRSARAGLHRPRCARRAGGQRRAWVHRHLAAAHPAAHGGAPGGLAWEGASTHACVDAHATRSPA